MSQGINIQIETTDRRLDFEMLGAESLSAGAPVTILDGVTATWSTPLLTKRASEPYVFNLVIGGVSTVGLNLVTSWLYDKLKGKPAKLRINRTEVEIEPDKIRIVIEQIEKTPNERRAVPKLSVLRDRAMLEEMHLKYPKPESNKPHIVSSA